MLGLLTLVLVGFATTPFVLSTDQSTESDDTVDQGDFDDNVELIDLASLVPGAEEPLIDGIEDQGDSDGNGEPVSLIVDAEDPVAEDPVAEEPVNEQVINVLVDSNEEYYAGTEIGDEILVAIEGPDPEGYVQIFNDDLYYFDGQVELSEINPGEGDDHIVIESGGIVVFDGLGSDTIDAHGLAAGVIYAGTGDLVLGSDNLTNSGSSATIGIVAEGATVIGGLAEETIIVTGSGSVVDGGAGDDYLLTFEGDAVLFGGDGDDMLIGNGNDLRYCECTRVFSVESYSNSSIDTLDGGSGNDRLELSRGDVGTGGEGLDEFRIYNGGGGELEAARVTDFLPSEDSLVVQVGGGDPWDYSDSSYDLTDRVTVSSDGSGTVISVDGEVSAVIDGVGELRVGIPEHTSLGRSGSTTAYVDIETGEIGSIGDFDALVYVFHATSS
jgi:Ca2+-binding RTX toxin-like protein